MPNATAHIPRSRTPKGTGQAGRINLSLLPEERDKLQRLADADCRTLSAMARVLVLRGMAETQPQGDRNEL